jgi:hypothetical protein
MILRSLIDRYHDFRRTYFFSCHVEEPALKIEAATAYETLVSINQAVPHHVPHGKKVKVSL